MIYDGVNLTSIDFTVFPFKAWWAFTIETHCTQFSTGGTINTVRSTTD